MLVFIQSCHFTWNPGKNLELDNLGKKKPRQTWNLINFEKKPGKTWNF